MASHRSQLIKQNFLLVWLDADIDETDDFFKYSLEQLRHVGFIKTFINPNECIDSITSIQNETIVLIVSGSLGQHIVPQIHSISQLKSIYIFCNHKSMHKKWTKQFFKIKGVHTNIKSICEHLKSDCGRCDRDTISISFNSIDSTFMYTHLIKKALLEIDDDKNAVKELVDYCRQKGIEEKQVKKFESEYNQQTPIWWYTSPTFIYEILNNGLRMLDIDILLKMGFFIRHLHNDIKELYEKQQASSNNLSYKFYRGQGLSIETFEKIKKSQGGLISFNNFLSTSTDRLVSEEFYARSVSLRDPNMVGILFNITIDLNTCDKYSVVFADVKDVGYYGGSEAEILFSTHTIFHIKEIIKIEESETIKLWQVNLIPASDDIDYDLRAVTAQIDEECSKTGWPRFAYLLIKLGQYEKAEQLYQTLLNNTSSELDRANYINNIGMVYNHNGDYSKALSFYQDSINMKINNLSENHADVADTYHNMGNVYQHIGEYSKALSYQERALSIRQKCLPVDHLRFSYSYIVIGSLSESMGDHLKALSFYEKSIEINEKRLSPYHPDFIAPYCGIGNVYLYRAEYAQALLYYKRALNIQQKSLPPNHPKLTISYQNFGCVHYGTGEYSKALSAFKRAQEFLRENHLSSDHPEWTSVHDNIGKTHYAMGDYAEALSSYEQAFNIMKKDPTLSQLKLTSSYTNISHVYRAMGDYSKALSIQERALRIQQKAQPPNQLHMAQSYRSIGMTYYEMGDYFKALSFYEKDLKIKLKFLHANHPDVAESYENMANLYNKKGDHIKALSFQKRALDILQKSLLPNHPKIAQAYMNIGSTYYYLGDNSKALSFNEKSLQISEKLLPPNPLSLASTYENIGLIYEKMGDYATSLSFLQRAFANRQNSLNPTHKLVLETSKHIQNVTKKIDVS